MTPHRNVDLVMHLPDEDGSLGHSESDEQDIGLASRDWAGAQEEMVTNIVTNITRTFISSSYMLLQESQELQFWVWVWDYKLCINCTVSIKAFSYFNPVFSSYQFSCWNPDDTDHSTRRDQSGANSVTSFWCRVWFGNIAWNWKVVFTTFSDWSVLCCSRTKLGSKNCHTIFGAEFGAAAPLLSQRAHTAHAFESQKPPL